MTTLAERTIRPAPPPGSPAPPFPRDFTPEQRACARADHGTNRSITVRIDSPTNKRTADSADDKADSTIATTTMQATVFAAPFTSTLFRVCRRERDCERGCHERRSRR